MIQSNVKKKENVFFCETECIENQATKKYALLDISHYFYMTY